MSTVSCVVLPAIDSIDPNDFGIGIGFPKQGETLPFLQESVGGYVDCFDIAHPETGAIASVWFHDEGKINGLPRNRFAELLAIIGGWAGPQFGDWIAGPVVLTGFDPESGETVTLPDEWGVTLAELAEQYRLALIRIAAQSN